jgi:hypothetical protein
MEMQGQGGGQRGQLNGSTQQQQKEEQVAYAVPLDLRAEAQRFLVYLQPGWQLAAVHEDFSALQLPAGHLQAALAPALEQQHHTLLPESGCCCSVDLQLVDVSVEQHPSGEQHGCVACVNMFSNVLPGLATLHAQQDGNCR